MAEVVEVAADLAEDSTLVVLEACVPIYSGSVMAPVVEEQAPGHLEPYFLP